MQNYVSGGNDTNTDSTAHAPTNPPPQLAATIFELFHIRQKVLRIASRGFGSLTHTHAHTFESQVTHTHHPRFESQIKKRVPPKLGTGPRKCVHTNPHKHQKLEEKSANDEGQLHAKSYTGPRASPTLPHTCPSLIPIELSAMLPRLHLLLHVEGEGLESLGTEIHRGGGQIRRPPWKVAGSLPSEDRS